MWKPHIINKTMHSMPEGSVLVYADSGSVCNRNGIHRFGEYVAAIDASKKKYGTQFTCCTSTRVQILTPEGLRARSSFFRVDAY